jgi:iron complex transport system substrate-binding protein
MTSESFKPARGSSAPLPKPSSLPALASALALLARAAALALLSALLLSSCSGGDAEKKAGEESGPKKPEPVSYALAARDGYIEATDCAYRSLALVPKGAPAPEGFLEARVVRVPAQRVVIASGHYDAGIMLAMGAASAIIATDQDLDSWLLPEIKDRLVAGETTFVGYWDALDYETIRSLSPDLILTSSHEVAQTLEDLGLPAAVTYNGLDNNLENRLRLFGFLGALIGAGEKAAELEQEIRDALGACSKASENLPKPKMSWGVFFQNRVYPLDGDFWLAEIMVACGGDYVLGDIRSGMMELSLEEFLRRSQDANIYFASLLNEGRVNTKADYLHLHPELARIKAFSPEGAAVYPEDLIFQDTGRLKNIILELAALIHPELYPGVPELYFKRLP